MKRNTKAIVAGVVIVGFVAFFFLAPTFYWFTADSPIITLNGNPQPIFTAYRSLGCEFLGFGDAYYTASVTFSPSGQSMGGVVFSCAAPLLPL